MTSQILFVLCLIIFSATGNDEFRTVQTQYGAVRGKLLSTLYDEKPYYNFLGIPYANPPLNELRFKVSYYY